MELCPCSLVLFRESFGTAHFRIRREGKIHFAYVYDYDDVPLWHECVLDCGYDTGHMELIPENEYRAMLLEEEQTALPFESQGEMVIIQKKNL